MLSVAQATDESQDGTIIPTRGIAGTRMAQAVVAAVGTIYGENGPEDVNRYITDNQLPPVIEAARQGHIGAIGTLNQTYERLYESWANDNNNVVNMISQLNTDIAQIDMKLIRTRYTANALQIIGLVIALFRDFTA